MQQLVFTNEAGFSIYTTAANFLIQENLMIRLRANSHHTAFETLLSKIATMKRSTSIKDRVQARISKLRNQKLGCKLETLTKEAEDLDTECQQLQTKADDFAIRASTTQAPEPPPADRKPLFQPNQPGSRYDAQVSAVKILNSQWHWYEKSEVKGFESKLEKFENKVQRLKKANLDPKAPMGSVEHQFESLDNALVNLKKRRAELIKAIAKVQLSIALPSKG